MAVKVKGDKTRDITEQERNTAVSSERLICCDIAQNGNKFWHGYTLANGDGFCEFGRVGKTRQHEYYTFGNVNDAQSWLADKSHEKQHKGGGKASYTPQKTISSSGVASKSVNAGKSVSSSDLRNIAATQIKGDPETKKLITWLADVNVHQITSNTNITYNTATGTFTTPLGLVTPDGISEARDILDDISDYVVKRDWINVKYQRYLSNYLRLIPTNVGMTRGWHETIFAGSDALQKQNDILDALEAALKPVGGVPSAAKNEQVFNVTLECVTDAILSFVKKKYRTDKGTHGDVKDYDVKQVWKVNITTVREAFEQNGRKIGNIQQLYHGSKASNLLSILKGGLVIPPASSPHVCGRMWADGVYMSSDATKSLRYATNVWTSGGETSRKFMFLCLASLGRQHVPADGSSWHYNLPSGYDSCWAKAGISGVQNHEQIVYKTHQVDLEYLIEFTPFGK